MAKSEVQQYLSEVQQRTISRWVIPPGVPSGEKVTLRFSLDVGGSASSVSVVKATHNALGASAVDALRAAAPFPPMPAAVRCLGRLMLKADFSNPRAG